MLAAVQERAHSEVKAAVQAIYTAFTRAEALDAARAFAPDLMVGAAAGYQVTLTTKAAQAEQLWTLSAASEFIHVKSGLVLDDVAPS